MDVTRPQKDPCEGKDSVTDEVINDLILRRTMGELKYGTELKTFNGRIALVDAYQEALELVLYLKQELMERYIKPNHVKDTTLYNLIINPHLTKEQEDKLWSKK